MHVPNYVPEPIRIEGNVDESAWKKQISFFNGVARLHAAYWLIPTAILLLPFHAPTGQAVVVAAAAVLLARFLPLPWRPILSAFAIGLAINALHLWSLPITVACAAGYIFIAARDYSRIGHFALSLIASITMVSLVSLAFKVSPEEARRQCWAVVVALLYGVTDLTSITFRRRPDQVHLAAADLFTDVWNGLTWIARTAEHLQKHFLKPRK